MDLSFHPEAREEYLEAAAFYERRRAGLGKRFSFEIEMAIASILEAPLRWPLYEEDVRRYVTHRFPYGVLYSVEGESVLILAVMHCAREPGYWRKRLS